MPRPGWTRRGTASRRSPPAPPASRPSGPPFDLAAPTPHKLSFTIDTTPARDVLALLGGAPDAPATLRHLKASANATAAIRAEGLSPDDFYGRLVSTIAGTPDPLLSTYIAKIPYFTRVLDAVETDGIPGGAEAYYVVTFPPSWTYFGGGTPTIQFYRNDGGNAVFDVLPACGASPYSCAVAISAPAPQAPSTSSPLIDTRTGSV